MKKGDFCENFLSVTEPWSKQVGQASKLCISRQDWSETTHEERSFVRKLVVDEAGDRRWNLVLVVLVVHQPVAVHLLVAEEGNLLRT